MTISLDEYLAGIPKRYQGIYQKAMQGQSKKAAIYAKCLDCVNWQRKEVALCVVSTCPLYPYRKTSANSAQNAVRGYFREKTTEGGR
ncbi:MAG: hypothetical protein WHS88_04220 [Anaerohalosphaeraceae bacterium]